MYLHKNVNKFLSYMKNSKTDVPGAEGSAVGSLVHGPRACSLVAE